MPTVNPMARQGNPYLYPHYLEQPPGQIPAGQASGNPTMPTAGNQPWDDANRQWAALQGITLPGGQAAGTGGAAAGGQGGVANITTSINPRNIYSQQQTTQARNQAVADAHQKANLPWVMKQLDKPGMSRGPQSLYRSMPAITGAYQTAAQAGAAIPLADHASNQQNMMQGQVAQGQQFDALSRLLLGQTSLNNWVGQQNIGGLAPLLAAIGGII